MRFLETRGDVPDELVEAAGPSTQAILNALAGEATKLAFRSYVYASDAVRTRLSLVQRNKCAFCEVKIYPVSTPHVEHFRPKAAYINEETLEKIKPGYYWLAYKWENLMLACPRCNSATYKGNRFPLEIEDARALSPDEDLDLEQPLLLDPFVDDPREFIRFRRGVAYAVDGNQKGETTIKVLGLNREDLVDSREEHLHSFKVIANAAAALDDGPEKTDLEDILTRLISESGQYLSCLEDNLP